ncbi:hypothetical protein, partial [Actinomadura geliboluensis]|uniref:hypothetical protein n=1 Tax=Actinomadura geliboluensis TaxID=882440 RepID=UPI00197AE6BA
MPQVIVGTAHEHLDPTISRTMRSRITRHRQQRPIREGPMPTKILPIGPVTIPRNLPHMPQMAIRTTREHLDPTISRTMSNRVAHNRQQVTIRERTVPTEILPTRPVALASDLPDMPQMAVRTTHEHLDPAISRTMRSRITRHPQHITIRKRPMLTKILPIGPVERPGLGGGPETWKGEGLWHPRESTPLSCVNARSVWSLSCAS